MQGGIEVLWQGGLGVQGFWGAVGGDLGLQRRFGVLPPTSPTLTMPGSSPEPLPLPLTGPITPPAPPTPPPAPQKKGLFTDDLHRLVDEWVQDTARAQVKGGAPLTPFLGCWGGPQYLNTSFPPPPNPTGDLVVGGHPPRRPDDPPKMGSGTPPQNQPPWGGQPPPTRG